MVGEQDWICARRYGQDPKGARDMLRLLHGVFLWDESQEQRLRDIRDLLESYFEEANKG